MGFCCHCWSLFPLLGTEREDPCARHEVACRRSSEGMSWDKKTPLKFNKTAPFQKDRFSGKGQVITLPIQSCIFQVFLLWIFRGKNGDVYFGLTWVKWTTIGSIWWTVTAQKEPEFQKLTISTSSGVWAWDLLHVIQLIESACPRWIWWVFSSAVVIKSWSHFF